MPGRSGSRAKGLVPLALVALLATACPSNDVEPQPRPSAGSPTEEPRAAGEVVVAYPHEPATLDPFAPAGQAPATRDLTRLLMPALYRLGPGGARERWLLAEDPVVSEQPRFTVSVRLREDAVWSDGTPITMDDLQVTWRHVMNRDAASRLGYDRIRRIVADAPKAGRIEFRARYDDWRDLFGAGLGVLPAHILEEDPDAFARAWPVSGGPFVLQRWRRGLDITFAPTPRAWGGDAPRLERLRVAFAPDTIGALELFRRGDADVLGPYHAPDWRRRVSEVPGVTISAETGAASAVLLFDTEAAPFDRPGVRRALAYAIDRARLVRGLIQAEGEELNGIDASDTSFARYTEDLARARGQLTNGLNLEATIALGGDDLSAVLLRAIQFQAQRVGFDLQAVSLDSEQLWSEWLDGPDMTLAIVILREPNLLALLPEGARRGADAASVGRTVPFLPLYRVSVGLAASARVSGVCASASPDGPLWNAHAWQVAGSGTRVEGAACPSLVAA